MSQKQPAPAANTQPITANNVQRQRQFGFGGPLASGVGYAMATRSPGAQSGSSRRYGIYQMPNNNKKLENFLSKIPDGNAINVGGINYSDKNAFRKAVLSGAVNPSLWQ